MRALARAEMILLRRNKVMLFNAVLFPAGLIAMLAAGQDGSTDRDGQAMLVGSFVATTLLLVVYFNLLCAYVARREERVLVRLRAGECRDGEILTGTAIPAVVIALGQVAILVLAGLAVLDLPLPKQPLVLLTAVGLGCLTFVGLALLTTLITRNVEAAQVTSLPLIAVCFIASGVAGQPDFVPEMLLRVMPMTPVVELTQVGWMGSLPDEADTGVLQAMALPLAVGLAWAAVGILAARRWFRWQARA
ncbi:ABC transporter permease [Cryptosporangium minutisporangium]